MKTKLAITATLALILCGCSALNPVPKTRISGTIAGQSFSLSNPKDTTIDSLSVTVSTNGTATLSIGHLSSLNNSNVISSSYSGQAASITAAGEQIIGAMKAGATLAGAAAGAAK